MILDLNVCRDHEYWLSKSDSPEESAIQVVPEFYATVEGSGNELELVVWIQEGRGDFRRVATIGVRRGATKSCDGEGRNDITCGRGMYFYG